MFVSGSGFKRVELPDYVQAVKTIGSDIHTSMAVEVASPFASDTLEALL